MHLTKKIIEALEYEPEGPKQQIYWDANFGVRVYESGKKSFVIRYVTADKKRRYMTVGKFPRMTLQNARSEANKLFVEVDGGEDPVADAKAATDAAAKAIKMDGLIDLFVEEHCKAKRKTWETDKKRLARHVLPYFKGRDPTRLNRRDFTALHREISIDSPTEANRVIETLRTMFRYAAREGFVADDFNPPLHVELNPEKSRERVLWPHEIKTLSDALAKIDSIYTRNYFWLLLLTATRRNELLEARWENVDLERGELYLPMTKNGTDHTVPLSSEAVRLFREMPRQKNNPWVFCSRIHGKRLTSVNKRWGQVRKAAGLDDVTLHDFRRTVASRLAKTNYSLAIIKALLNHTLEGATAVYARVDSTDPLVREAVEEYGRWVMCQAKGEAGEVAKLKDSTEIDEFSRQSENNIAGV